MPNPTTTADLFDILSRSGLFTPDSLAAYERLFEQVTPPPSPQMIVRRLLDDGAITSFQARFLQAGRYKGFFIGGKYKLLANIGSGGMGEVFLAEHLLLHRLVAIKILRLTNNTDSTGAVERFIREARAAATLKHPNIAQLFDVERNGLTPYMVMEFLDGASLHTVGSEHGPLSVVRSVNYAVQIARGLQHAHDAGLVHRDIKPGNLILERDGTIKILDLGLARFHADNSKNNNLTARYDENNLIGTADFIAPEQTHDSSAVDGRADIYSLGCTLYFFLTGQAPFQDGSIAQKLLWHQLKQPASVSTFRSDVPADLQIVLHTMMAKDRDRRYQTAKEVQVALAPWFETNIAPPPSSEMPKRKASAYRLGLVAEAPGSEIITRTTMPILAGGPPSGDPMSPMTGRYGETGGRNPRTVPAPSVIPGSGDTVPSSGEATSQLPLAAKSVSVVVAPAEPARAERARKLRRWALLAGIQIALLTATILFVTYLNRKSNQTNLPAKPWPVVPEETPKTAFAAGGSTFIQSLMDEWAQEFQQQAGAGFTYEANGSGAGLQGLLDGQYDLACTDEFLTDAKMLEAKKNGKTLVHIPLAMGAVAVAYNLPGSEGKLYFSGDLLAEIYLGAITRWNHPKIRAENPTGDLPDREIVVIFREDKSGTTAIWTEFLAKTAPEKWTPGMTSKIDRWPVGRGATKNEGVAKEIAATDGAIGYLALGAALQRNSKLSYGRVRNAEGVYLPPSLTSVTNAAKQIPDLQPHLRFSIVNSKGKDSYPVCGTTWAVFDSDMADKAKRQAILDFLAWATGENAGQRKTAQLDFAPLPQNVVFMIESVLSRLRPR